MVKFFEKKKIAEVYGRIIVTPFRKLKKEYFPHYKDDDKFFLNFDGKIYVNSTEAASEGIVSLLKILAQYPKKELKKWEKEQKRRHPDIEKIEDLTKLKEDNEEFMKALSGFLVPLEIKSREMQKEYYGIL